MSDFASTTLPKSRASLFIEVVAARSARTILLAGLCLYIFPVAIVTLAEYFWPSTLVFHADETPASLGELWYFNFITILTVGYGDLHPVGMGRCFPVAEAAFGMLVFSLLIAAFTAKVMSAPRNAIVFSRYCYYCTDQQMILLIFVNTTRSILIDADMSSYLKLGGHWLVTHSIRSPFKTRSVQSFFIRSVPLDDLVKQLQVDDVFRFSISGKLCGAVCTAAIEYDVNNILVLQNRDKLTQYHGFIEPTFRSDISEMFHYCPENAVTLIDFVANKRRNSD